MKKRNKDTVYRSVDHEFHWTQPDAIIRNVRIASDELVGLLVDSEGRVREPEDLLTCFELLEVSIKDFLDALKGKNVTEYIEK